MAALFVSNGTENAPSSNPRTNEQIQRNVYLTDCYSNVTTETAGKWLQRFVFA